MAKINIVVSKSEETAIKNKIILKEKDFQVEGPLQFNRADWDSTDFVKGVLTGVKDCWVVVGRK